MDGDGEEGAPAVPPSVAGAGPGPSSARPYPAAWEADVVLADGGTVHVRPITPADADRLVAMHGRLSPETIQLRFFSPRPRLAPRDVARFTTVDHHDRVALIAELGDAMIAVARYERIGATDEAEVSFVVEDAHQGRGVGTILLEHLAAAGRDRGLRRFVAETLPENRRMIGVFRDAGFRATSHYDHGVVIVEFPIDVTGDSLAAQQERERRSEARSVARLLEPRSIAVIGASRTPGTIGHELLQNLLRGGFSGPVYPVHATAAHVASVRAYPTVLDVPDAVDLAIIAVPAAQVLEVVEQCAHKGVKGLIVVSAGFWELGVEGAEMGRAVVAAARRNGMRMIGPSSMGVVNTAPGIGLHATFSPVRPVPGRVSFLSQSGALGIAVLQWTAELGLGISSFVSVGDKADVSGNDLVQYWEEDPGTDVVLLYLESFGNPAKFARIARRVARRKPIVVVKSGRGRGEGRRRPGLAGAAGTDVAVDALFRQAGVIRVDALEELFEVAQVLAWQPLPAGRRVAVLTNAGGPGVLAADALVGAGLEVPPPSPTTASALRSRLPARVRVANPLDLSATASADHYAAALEALLADEGVDAVVVIFTPSLEAVATDVGRVVAEGAARSSKPVVANLLGHTGAAPTLEADGRTVPSFRSPEAAAVALARAAGYAAWRRRPEGSLPELGGIDLLAAAATVAAALVGEVVAPAVGAPPGPVGDGAGGHDVEVDGDDGDGGGVDLWVGGDVARDLLGAYGVGVVPAVRADTVEAAVAGAERLGWPVAVKLADADRDLTAPAAVTGRRSPSRPVAAGVQLDLPDADALRAAVASLRALAGAGADDDPCPVVVQPMVEPGVEAVAGVVEDPTFGPLVAFGLGGPVAELLGDRAFRILPLTDLDAAELVRAPRTSPLLFGHRGAPPADVAAVEDLLLRIARLVEDVPQVAEVVLDPLLVRGSGVVAVDARVRLVAGRRRARAERRLDVSERPEDRRSAPA